MPGVLTPDRPDSPVLRPAIAFPQPANPENAKLEESLSRHYYEVAKLQAPEPSSPPTQSNTLSRVPTWEANTEDREKKMKEAVERESAVEVEMRWRVRKSDILE